MLKRKMKNFFQMLIFYVTKSKQYVKDKDDIIIEYKIVIYIKLRVKQDRKRGCNIQIFRGFSIKMLDILNIFI